MPRPKKPASVTTGHTQSKADLEKRMAEEKRMKGSGDQVDTPPSIISMNDNAVAFYAIIVEMLKDADILSNLDRFAIGMLADNLAKLKEANEQLMDRGTTIMQTTKSGEKEVVNPIYQVWKDSQNNFSKLATQFGLTPSSRASLSDISLQQREDDEDTLQKAFKELDAKRDSM